MRLTITTDYAIRIVCFLAEHQQMTSTAELANELGVPVNYIPKITKQLKKANLISSLEGIKGGYVLAKSPENISLMDVLYRKHYGDKSVSGKGWILLWKSD